MSAKTTTDAREEKGHSRDNVGILSRQELTAKSERQNKKETAPKDTVLDQADGAGGEDHVGEDA